jgi:hydrogenase expression/formation protein HypE
MVSKSSDDENRQDPAFACPIPQIDGSRILLGHGGGGKLTQMLIDTIFAPAFANPFLDARHDGAVVELGGRRVAFTTDAYVVRPLFFPGGDIGRLAVYGTVNDLAMCGARPLFMSLGLVLEEGLPIDTLRRLTHSMQAASTEAGVQIVTGDTKVVDKGKGDEVFVCTSGIGLVEHDVVVAPDQILPGDAVVLSGDVGRHGIAVMASREGLEFETPIESDSMPLAALVLDLLDAGMALRCMRDLTRGGLATALIEIATTAHRHIEIDETKIAVSGGVRGACEILGFDPLYVANEGRFVAFVRSSHADRVVEIMRAHPGGAEAAVIGRVAEQGGALVTMRTAIGGTIVLDAFSGEQLPRIC